MYLEEKNLTQSTQPVQQQVFVFSDVTDFNSTAIREQMEKVQEDVKSVMEGAIIDSSKLSLNFTV